MNARDTGNAPAYVAVLDELLAELGDDLLGMDRAPHKVLAADHQALLAALEVLKRAPPPAPAHAARVCARCGRTAACAPSTTTPRRVRVSVRVR